MEFQRGDRVFMAKHADWKSDAVGTIISFRARPRTLYDGSIDLEYSIEFDEPQRDFTDELNGKDLQYKSSTVLGRFLRPLGRAV
jgi:hypothetical protein